MADRLFRAIRGGYWDDPGEPILSHYNARAASPDGFQPGRWNDEAHYALYTSHDADTAYEEAAQYSRPTTGWTGGVAARAYRDRIVVIQFESPPVRPPLIFDGEANGMLSDRSIKKLLEVGQHSAGRRYAARYFYGHIARAIVPSAPLYARGIVAWNSVLYVAPNFWASATFRVGRSSRLFSSACPKRGQS